jgi:hypothetical protein
LVKVRDEMRNILNGYKNLYESSIAFGMRKKINSDKKKSEMVKIFLLEIKNLIFGKIDRRIIN